MRLVVLCEGRLLSRPSKCLRSLREQHRSLETSFPDGLHVLFALWPVNVNPAYHIIQKVYAWLPRFQAKQSSLTYMYMTLTYQRPYSTDLLASVLKLIKAAVRRPSRPQSAPIHVMSMLISTAAGRLDAYLYLINSLHPNMLNRR